MCEVLPVRRGRSRVKAGGWRRLQRLLRCFSCCCGISATVDSHQKHSCRPSCLVLTRILSHSVCIVIAVCVYFVIKDSFPCGWTINCVEFCSIVMTSSHQSVQNQLRVLMILLSAPQVSCRISSSTTASLTVELACCKQVRPA